MPRIMLPCEGMLCPPPDIAASFRTLHRRAVRHQVLARRRHSWHRGPYRPIERCGPYPDRRAPCPCPPWSDSRDSRILRIVRALRAVSPALPASVPRTDAVRPMDSATNRPYRLPSSSRGGRARRRFRRRRCGTRPRVTGRTLLPSAWIDRHLQARYPDIEIRHGR